MQDILDSTVLSQKLGMISMDPRQLAKQAKDSAKGFGVPTIVFVDAQGQVFAHPAAYAVDRAVDEIVGTYTHTVANADLVDDLLAVLGPRLGAIGILARHPRPSRELRGHSPTSR